MAKTTSLLGFRLRLCGFACSDLGRQTLPTFTPIVLFGLSPNDHVFLLHRRALTMSGLVLASSLRTTIDRGQAVRFL